MGQHIPETIAAFGAFGFIFILPLVYMLQKHQKAMAEVIHRQPAVDLHRRIESLEREVRELRAAQHEQILKADDQRELSRRVNSS